MAKGGNNQRSNYSRFTKPYDASNSFVKKVALRVSGYIGGLFGSSVKSNDSVSGDKAPFRGTDDATLSHSHYDATDSGKPMGMSRCYDDIGVNNSSGKTLKVGTKRKYAPELPISPIASTSSLFQSSLNHNYDIQNSEDFIASVAGPSGLQNQKYAQANSITTSTSTNTNIKANGATDNHSDSSESTSGCSSLVPQSDRLSQSAFVSNSRKKILEEKLQYVRQLKQNRTSMYFNRSIPVVGDTTGSRRKPSFDISVYGSPIFEKSSVREKMVNSPFYTGQTSYGGASAYKRTRTALYPQQSGKSTFERKEGMQIQVKPSHHGSTEDLSNMSHTAKRILEALEQFSTPISDAKRIPVNAGSPPLGRKRTRYGDTVQSVASLSTIKTAANTTKGPVISGLNIPTVPDLLKLKRLEKIQDSTAAARQVAVEKQEYSLRTDVKSSKHTGKIITKIKDKEKEVNFERPPEVNLPKIPLPISTLPKFDFKLPPIAPPTTDNSAKTKCLKTIDAQNTLNTKLSEPNKTFTFSPPISLSAPENIKNSIQKSNFTFSTPLKANSTREKSESAFLSNLSYFMSAEALSKLKRKPVNDKPNSPLGIETPRELKCGSVMDLLRKTLENSKQVENESVTEKTEPVNDTRENISSLNKNQSEEVKPPQTTAGFGDMFKKKAGQWECSVCLIQNKEGDVKCAACETPKPGAKVDKPEPPKFNFGVPAEASTFKFGIDKADVKNGTKALEPPKPASSQPNGPRSEPASKPFGSVATSFGVFTFGIPQSGAEPKNEKEKDACGKLDFPKTPGQEKQQKAETFGSPAKTEESNTTNEVALVSKDKDAKSTIMEDAVDTEEKDARTNLLGQTPANNTAVTKEFSFQSQNKPVQTSLFSFGSPENTGKPLATISNPINTSSVTFGPNLKMPEGIPSSGTNFTFGQPISVNSQATASISCGNNDLNKPSPFSKFCFSEKSDQPEITSNIPNVDSTKIAEKTSDTANTNATLTTAITTTNSVFGASESEKTNWKIGADKPAAPFMFGGANSTPVATTTSAMPSTDPNIFTFGAPKQEPKPLKFSSGFDQSTFAFGTPNPGSRNIFGNLNQPKTASPFGNSNSTFGNSTPNPFGQESDRGNNDLNKPSPFPKFNFTGKTDQSGLASDIRNVDTSKNMEKISDLATTNASLTLNTTNPIFGSSDSGRALGKIAPGKSTAPFIFGESNNSGQTSTPAMSETAPNIFTFGASKPETKPLQFSGGFGQSSGTFTFGAPNPGPRNVFGNFSQPKTASPFANSNSTFGNPTPNPFGQSSAPASFGVTAPKFEFGSSSQQTQSTSQPFQFGAAKPQTMAGSTPATAFSTSVPETFNFTGRQTPKFSAVPTSTPIATTRKVARAVRRTQR